jgi:hypothetical protein
MASLSKFITVILTSLSLLTLPLTSWSKSAFAKETYLDDSCRYNQRLEQSDRFLLFYKSEFRANRQTYWFSAARYQDGAVLFCISKPNFNEAKPLSVKELQYQFIDKIVQGSNSTTTFIITVAEGNGAAVPLTDYRLNLSNPNRPILTRLRTR